MIQRLELPNAELCERFAILRIVDAQRARNRFDLNDVAEEGELAAVIGRDLARDEDAARVEAAADGDAVHERGREADVRRVGDEGHVGVFGLRYGGAEESVVGHEGEGGAHAGAGGVGCGGWAVAATGVCSGQRDAVAGHGRLLLQGGIGSKRDTVATRNLKLLAIDSRRGGEGRCGGSSSSPFVKLPSLNFPSKPLHIARCLDLSLLLGLPLPFPSAQRITLPQRRRLLLQRRNAKAEAANVGRLGRDTAALHLCGGCDLVVFLFEKGLDLCILCGVGLSVEDFVD